MKKSFSVLMILSLAASFAFGQKTTKPRARTIVKATNLVKVVQKPNELLPMLPSADAVVSMDMQKMLTVLPTMFEANSPRISQMNNQIDSMKAKTGIDLRSFQNLGMAVRFKTAEDGNVGAEVLALARGTFNANALLAVAKVAAKGKYREEVSGERTIILFNAGEILKDAKNSNPDISEKKLAMLDKALDWMLKQFSGEIAVTAFDDKTLAIGSSAMLHDTLDAKSHVSSDLNAMVNAKSGAMLSFAGNMPAQTAKIFGFDNDEIGKLLTSLRQVYGSFDVNNVNGSLQIGARTSANDEAKQLEETLLGFQILGSGILGGKKDDTNKIYAKMVDNAKITRNNNEVKLDLDVPNTDMKKLVAKF